MLSKFLGLIQLLNSAMNIVCAIKYYILFTYSINAVTCKTKYYMVKFMKYVSYVGPSPEHKLKY